MGRYPTITLRHCLLQRGDNVILMGSPGAGKTSVGRILGTHLGREVIDVDDDVLESVWGMTVADKVVLIIQIFGYNI